MNNAWNKVVYKYWSFIYDTFFNTGIFLKARQKVFTDLNIPDGGTILFVGVGTGADISYVLRTRTAITAIDYSEEMMKVAKKKYHNHPISFFQMDAQNLEFENESFDFIIANLVISVVPDPQLALKETVRVLKCGGSLLIFDKFIPKHKRTNLIQQILRPIIKLVGTDIGLNFNDIYKVVENNCIVVEDKQVMFKGIYRKIMITKIT